MIIVTVALVSVVCAGLEGGGRRSGCGPQYWSLPLSLVAPLAAHSATPTGPEHQVLGQARLQGGLQGARLSIHSLLFHSHHFTLSSRTHTTLPNSFSLFIN